ncbi:hypothetical protein PHYPSEUDO_005890 [Phytophthora pseudosyringae]|uniref:OTU domain-containing protein n=1 Tax=Phytophthora pseudosyringae TaxID=221518 RepID=A0A8T1WGM7_9STRA|nr:hypothetical protein PHYPSEUDO_005890 [Phytophthora pseudosyringae]
MGRKTVKKLAKKAPKVIFEAATGKRLDDVVAKVQRVKAKHKQRKDSSYVVDDDAISLMRRQLAQVGCKLHVGRRWRPTAIASSGRGNKTLYCAALGDQLFGDQHQHGEVREEIVRYLEQHRDDFEPFMEDEEKFDKYCARMRDDGTWGGNQELYAAARLFQVYVVVHQDQSSARIMVIECDGLKPTRFVHVAYHGEDHYDSVRALKDPVEPDNLPVSIELDCDGFRAEDLAERWQTHSPASASEDHAEQRVVPTAPTHTADGDVDRLARRLGEQIQVAAGSGTAGASGKTLSKKEQRQVRRAEKQARSAARTQAPTPE